MTITIKDNRGGSTDVEVKPAKKGGRRAYAVVEEDGQLHLEVFQPDGKCDPWDIESHEWIEIRNV